MTAAETRISRLAPSPTGAMHLGNARTFLINWAMARQNGWRLVMRIEDLVGPRLKPETAHLVMEQLRWLGIDWDGEPLWQSHDLAPYQNALKILHSKGLLYPCTCTRKEIEMAQSAPHADEHELRYPGTCRPLHAHAHAAEDRAAFILDDDATTAWRVAVPDEPIEFHDMICGDQRMNVQEQVGDFIVATKNGQPAYQLAVVVDDMRQGVTDVVRGDDLLRSAARQIWLYRMLAQADPPALATYWHLPLVLGPDGKRLAKRHGDTRLLHYADHSVRPERIIGLMAAWCGIVDQPTEMTSRTFAERFDLTRLPREPVTFTDENDAWLLEGAG